MRTEVAPHRAYIAGTCATMAVFGLAMVALSRATPGYLAGPLLDAAILVPCLAVAAHLWVTMRFLRRADEYVRAVMARRFLTAALLAILAVTSWGLFEAYAGAPHLPAWVIYPVFWLFAGAVMPFIRNAR
jgi:hypothetical protein